MFRFTKLLLVILKQANEVWFDCWDLRVILTSMSVESHPLIYFGDDSRLLQ